MARIPRHAFLLPALGVLLAGGTAAAGAVPAPSPEYVSDHPELLVLTSQDWGELGLNVAAHQKGVSGAPLAIAGKTYTKGLGHHANGAITLLLDGEYSAFDAEVGLQPCGGGGSVIFRAFVDGRPVFDSGVMVATNSAKPVHLDLRGAGELRLEANDAGDGITCDMANWAEARLAPDSGVRNAQSAEGVDIAPFGRVVTWDPDRMDGARANRIQEYRAEDIYFEKPLTRDREGAWEVPVNSHDLACIGIQWLNRRALKQLDVLFAQESRVPAAEQIQVQGWFGESAWQGAWRRLNGEVEIQGQRIIFRLAANGAALQTQKVRWVFSNSRPARVQRLSAYTRSRWKTVAVVLESDRQVKSRYANVRIINGELVKASRGHRAQRLKSLHELSWNTAKPLHLEILSSLPSPLKSDPTVIQFRLREGSFGTAVDDLRTHPRVYLPDFGVSVARDPAPISLAEYQKQIAAEKTILQQVRTLPDQTLSQAMARTHHDAQKEGPVLLSLAADNLKFVLERDGTLRFPSAIGEDDWFATAGEIRPVFGTGKTVGLTRELEGGWLPIPVITLQEHGIVYRQRTFVTPGDFAGKSPTRMGRVSLCVMEFAVTNTTAASAAASIQLRWLLNSRSQVPADVSPPGTSFRLGHEGLQALVCDEKESRLAIHVGRGLVSASGQLPPGAGSRLVLLLANGPIDTGGSNGIANRRQQVEDYWRAMLKTATRIETPDPLLNNLIRSSQVRCLIAARNESDGRRIAPWIAAMSYGPLESEANSVIRGMDYLGHAEFARRAFDYFIARYNTNGFLTTGYTTFGTAWHLWTLGEHYQLHRDKDWLRGVAPELIRVGEWIVRQTEKTKACPAPRRLRSEGALAVRADGRPPEYGLMPPGVLADWNAFAYHYAMNAYYYAALTELAVILPDLGNRAWTDKAKRFRTSAADLRRNLLEAYRWTQSQAPALPLRNGTWIPHYPSQVHSPGKLADFFPGQDAGRSWCYDVELGAHQLVPAGVFQPLDAEVTRLLDHMEDVQFLADGWFDYPAKMNEQDWFNLGGFSKVQPYYTRNCELYALRDNVKPFIRSYFNTLAAMLNPEVLTFWEHFNHSGAWDKTHETGYFLYQTRTMLVMERGRDLWLAPLVTSNWFGEGMALSVSNAPTRFGTVNYEIKSRLAEDRIEMTITPPERQPPEWIVVRLRHPGGKPIAHVEVNAKRLRTFDPEGGLVRLRPKSKLIQVCVYYRGRS